MADFINTIDALGDGAVFDSIIDRTITEFKDDVITKVRQYAFCNCTALETVDAPNVNAVNSYAFRNTPSLVKLNVPNATRLEGYLFQGTSPYALKEIVCSNAGFFGVQAICHTAVEELDIHVVTEFNNAALPDTLTVLILRSEDGVSSLKYAISNCSPVIYIPSALYDDYIAANNWSALTNQFRKLEEWTVDGTVTGEINLNQHMVRFFNEDGTFLGYVIVPTGSTAVYTGDEPVKEGDWRFTGWNPSPTNVTADMDCYAKFRSTVIVKLIDGTITEISNDVATSISYSALQNCSALTTADFPAATGVGEYAFSGCSALTTLILRNTEKVATLSATNAFNNTPIASGTGFVYVPKTMADGSDGVAAYQTASNWSNFASQIRAIEDYPEICGGDS